MKYKILYSLGVAVFAFVGMSLLTTPSAKAALPGEDGPIVYIDSSNGKGDELTTPVNSVVTTDPAGTVENTVASTENPITAATVSNPTPSNQYDIVYAEQVPKCSEIIVPEISLDGPSPDSGCPVYMANDIDAKLSKVTTDQNGAPVTAPSELTTLDSLFEKGDSYSNVYKLSYAADGKTVLANQGDVQSYCDGECFSLELSALKLVDTTTGATQTIIEPTFDQCLSGGFGANGTVFFSRLYSESLGSCDTYGAFYDSSNQSDIWYIPTGSTTPVQLTFSDGIAEYYIDAAPDNSVLLVADALTCSYAYGVRYQAPWYALMPACDYYYISTVDGSATKLEGLVSQFVPTFFSPDGTNIIGTYYPQHEISLFAAREFDPQLPSTAVVSRNNLSAFVAITNLLGVQEWAPKVAATPTIPTVTATTAPTLPNTGANSIAVLAFAAALVALGGASLATSRRR